MKIRLTKPFGDVVNGGVIRRVGTIMDVPDGVAEMWIRRHRAERVEPAEEEAPVTGEQPKRARRKVPSHGA